MTITEFILARTRVGIDDPIRRLAELHESKPGWPRKVCECGRETRPEGPPACQECGTGQSGWPPVCDTSRLLAAVWSDHPDYREEWSL